MGTEKMFTKMSTPEPHTHTHTLTALRYLTGVNEVQTCLFKGTAPLKSEQSD